MTVEGEYFKGIYNEILTAGVLLVDTCWRKWVKKDIVAATKSLDIVLVKSLMKEEWSVAEKLGYYAKHIEIKNINAKYDLTISYCVALKRQGKTGEVNKEIGTINEEELTSLQLAQVSVLKDDKDSFYMHVKKAAEKKEAAKESFYTKFDWPALNEIRKDEDYKDKIDKAFNGVK